MKDKAFPYSRRTIKNKSVDFRIAAVVADGQWYPITKWRKLARVSEEEINEWIDKNIQTGNLMQSPTGARSYRFPLKSVIRWHRTNNLEIGEQILDYIFPARVWDNMTEVEGFAKAPLREIGAVTFECNPQVAQVVAERLRGIAKVREDSPGRYKAYCLSANYVKPIIKKVFDNYTLAEASRIYSRSSSQRREMIDFSVNFSHYLLSFYRNFAKTLVKKEMETIRIYIPEKMDQESQIIAWVITAIEKFDETSSVPFSGYLNSVLKHWPYDLPHYHLGRDLSVFQRERSKAMKKIRERMGATHSISNEELAREMGMRPSDFLDLEEKHHVWIKTKTAGSLTWSETSEEKEGDAVMSDETEDIHAIAFEKRSSSDAQQSYNLSMAIIQSAINSELYFDAFAIISQMGTTTLDPAKLESVSEDFILELGNNLGVN